MGVIWFIEHGCYKGKIQKQISEILGLKIHQYKNKTVHKNI